MSRLTTVAPLLVLSLIACIGVCNATPVLAPPSPLCTSLPGAIGSPTDVALPFATWSAVGFNCTEQDKIYSNFTLTGVPNTTILEFQDQVIGPVDLHTVTFNGNFLTPFSVSYDIAINLVMSPSMAIVRVSGDLSNPSDLGAPSNTKQISNEAGVLLGTLTSVEGNPGGSLITNNTALHAVDTYAANSGAAVSFSNTFAEAEVPESATLSMIGIGLIVFSVRKRLFAS